MASNTHRGHKRMLVGTGVAAAVVAAPHVLPSLGVGTAFMAEQVNSLCAASGGAGLAGALNSTVAAIPGVGTTLAQGGWAAAITSGILGLGGSLLGNYIHKHYDKPGHIQWGKVIKYASLATSMLIALPSILSGLSMGLTFLAFAFGSAAVASSMAAATSGTLGMMGGMNIATTGAAFSSFIPHIFTCGAAALPALGALFVAHPKSSPQAQTWTERVTQSGPGWPPLATPSRG